MIRLFNLLPTCIVKSDGLAQTLVPYPPHPLPGGPCMVHARIIRDSNHGSQITGDGIWALVISGKSLVVTGDANYW
jgi:hypothetical protein